MLMRKETAMHSTAPSFDNLLFTSIRITGSIEKKE